MFQTADPLLILAGVLIAGMSLGAGARRLGLPGVTGMIVAGIVLGNSGLALFEDGAVEALRPLTHFALALMGVTIGAHLNLQRLRNAGKRLFLLLLAEATITPLVVGGLLYATGEVSFTLAALLGTIAISTAPATIVSLVRETRSAGVFVKTLIAAVAINNMACIFLFEVARGVGRVVLLGDITPSADPAGEMGAALLGAGMRLGAAILLGAGAAVTAQLLTYRVVRADQLTTVSAVSILLTFGLASHADLSPLLACMALGVVQTNLNPARDRLVDSVFENFEPAILCVFFTLAGIHLHFDHFGQAGLIAGAFVATRIAGKLLSASLAMRLAGATLAVRRCLGMALVPQAGVAIGLVILIQEDMAFAPLHDVFVAVVLLAVTLNELVGPVFTRVALARTGEAGRDQPRLVDFLREENIVTNFHATSMEEAIRKLTDLLIASHNLRGVSRDDMLRSVLEREEQVSTCLGGGIAVPHGEIPEGSGMLGVMALSREGIEGIETPDGVPIRCMVLLATPHGERDRHLEVLAALARSLGPETAIKEQLFAAKSPAHAYEILHGESAADFNYFLEGNPTSSRY